MSLINSLENRFGRHAVPGLVNYIAGFQVAVWILLKFRPEFIEWLPLNKMMLLHGEVWRLVTFVFVPGNMHPVWMVFAVMILLMIGDTLDAAWGPFRVNLYVLGGIVFAATGVLLQQQWEIGDLFRSQGMERIVGREVSDIIRKIPDAGAGCSLWFSSSIFFAFACVAPNYEIRLFMILPLKVKYIAMLNAGFLLLDFIDSPPVRVPMFFSLLNFFIASGPSLWQHFTQRTKVAARRTRFESARRPAGSFFHRCAVCSKTELDDATLEFRVTPDGEEYCTVCRPKKPV